VNVKTRRTCAACRLAKCFRMGMSSELIRKEDRKLTKSNTTVVVLSKQRMVRIE
jgi:hypothetical protein